jgi:hypothetical protein
VRTQVDAKVIATRSPIILIIRMSLSCLNKLRVSPGLRDLFRGRIRRCLPPYCDAHHLNAHFFRQAAPSAPRLDLLAGQQCDLLVADGRIGFIVFRRDVANSPPDRIAVRVIAKIKQSLKFARNGKAETARLDDVWTVRNISYDFRVAPIRENPEMLLLRPENPEFKFAPGRYALVVKGQAYDFTVAGEITETAQCLERTEAANGTFYSECRTLD